ncbi:DEAD/DEAH box helicase [Streptomyces spectabilis]|uniref:DEAD/DEAH box helicase n=2 Tax=Streptomyces spectabilis TaxID=68270 RepID=A0A516RFF1_STRST|nr:DEAD/DEAH box helicase [Streptomyces spectabilis]
MSAGRTRTWAWPPSPGTSSNPRELPNAIPLFRFRSAPETISGESPTHHNGLAYHAVHSAPHGPHKNARHRAILGIGMTFHGLFVGIDHYETPFNRLRYAQRDAIVLHALFSDNLDGRATLLLDGEATKERFIAEMRHLAEVSTGADFVVIAFSGHGIPGGALATYDTTADRLSDTSLSLDDFTELTRGIRASSLLLVLDCCFSGHAADKVLHVPQDTCTSRDGSVSAMRRIDELRQAGHVVIAASGRDQEAFEEQEFRHGLLSHYLIQGLLGAPGAADGDRIYILKLAHYVSMSVSVHRNGRTQVAQEPVLGGSISNISFNVFTKGERYHATADAHRPDPVTAQLSSLAPYNIPEPVVEAWGNDRIKKLNQLQIDAINQGALLEGMNVLVSSPTSTGKTMVGELGAMRAVTQGKKAVFLLPTRALVNEQYERFRDLYGPLGFRVIRATGELRDQVPDLINGDFELAVLTYEKFIGLLPKRPDLLSAGVLVLDEIQSLMLPERGPLLETLLTWLRVRDGVTDTPQLVGLSAVLGKPDEFARWLRANLITATRRNAPLLEGVMGPDGRYRYRDQQGNEAVEQLLEPARATDTAEIATADQLVTRLVSKLVGMGQQVIVFQSTRREARTLARDLSRTLGLPAADAALEALPGGDGGRASELLHTCLAGGVAFHIADLTAEERRLLEQSFADPESQVRVLVATSTLAQGVNLPAGSVVVDGLEHPPPDSRPYSVSEYKNMAGRAGRLGLGKDRQRGRAIILTRGTADADQKWQRYVQGEPEDVRSAMLTPSTDVRAVVLSSLAEPAALVRRRSGPDVERFLAATFAAHQARVNSWPEPFPEADVRRMVRELVATGFLRETSHGQDELPRSVALTDLGELTVRSGLCVDSVAAVAAALGAVPADLINRATLVCAAQLASELDDIRFNWLPRTAYQEHTRLAARLRDRGAAEPVLSRLLSTPRRSGVGIGRARRSIACLMWADGVALADIERAISDPQKKTRPGFPGPVRHAVQRAADVMATVIEITFHVHPAADLGSLPDVFPAQLELGAPEGLVPIAWHAKVPLLRPVYLALARSGLASPADVVAADPDLVLDCVGSDDELRRVVLVAAAAALEEAH